MTQPPRPGDSAPQRRPHAAPEAICLYDAVQGLLTAEQPDPATLSFFDSPGGQYTPHGELQPRATMPMALLAPGQWAYLDDCPARVWFGDPAERRVLALVGAAVALQRATGALSFPTLVYEEETPGKRRGLRLLADLKRESQFGPLLHVSFSYVRHLPQWRDIKSVKATFFGPDRDAMQVLPREADYVNDHPYCLHLWGVPDAWLRVVEMPELWGIKP